jgi:hypothetical protein
MAALVINIHTDLDYSRIIRIIHAERKPELYVAPRPQVSSKCYSNHVSPTMNQVSHTIEGVFDHIIGRHVMIKDESVDRHKHFTRFEHRRRVRGLKRSNLQIGE